MAKFTMTASKVRTNLIYQLDFMGRSYPVHFKPTEDGMTSVEKHIFLRVPNFDNLPENIKAALLKFQLSGTICDINEAVQTLTQYERERMSHTDAPRHHIRR